MTVWSEDSRDCIRALLRLATDNLQAPRPNSRADRLRMALVPAKYVRQTFLVHHLQCLLQPVNEVRGWCIWEKPRLTTLQHSLPVPIRPWHFCGLVRRQSLLRNGVKTQTGRIHQALLRSRDGNVNLPFIVAIVDRP